MSETQKDEWHVTFVLKGVPKDFFIHDDDYYICHPTSEILKIFIESVEGFPEIKGFLAGITDPKQLAFATFRIFGDGDKDEVIYSKSKYMLDSLVDFYGLIEEVKSPEVADIILVRLNRDDDVLIRRARDWGTVQFNPQGDQEKKAVDAYTSNLGHSMLPLADLLFEASKGNARTKLEQQISYSCAVFRRSINPKFDGLEYLGKFAALEGLVCGPISGNKGHFLTSRLSALFRNSSTVEERVRKLWKKRGTAVHQARFFHSEQVEKGEMLSIYLGDLHWLFVGVLLFATSNSKKYNTVCELWDHVDEYELPEWAQSPNPGHSQRAIICLWVERPVKVWKGAGKITDQFFPLSNSK